jgi:hypothetical protein
MNDGGHISDVELLMAVDNELGHARAAEVQRHVGACVVCRNRKDQITGGLREASEVLRIVDMNPVVAQRSRTRLRARLQEAARERTGPASWKYVFFGTCAAALAFVLAIVMLQPRKALEFFEPASETKLLPNPTLTPGFSASVTEAEICEPGAPSMSRFIPSALAQHIFDEYGIGDPRPRGYELDYLIDPELGGSDDPRNLWPQPYSAEWNARLKDALEDHLHQMVCTGQLSLSTAQRDVAVNWIAAYRKYFHTNRPIVAHMAFTKDMPWESSGPAGPLTR